ncbi:hypothetical protein ZWY2020_010921 [Hordeum vulgare]|nr:hypothetical protein ZWY2020_010921 [Hordeum vulgare]
MTIQAFGSGQVSGKCSNAATSKMMRFPKDTQQVGDPQLKPGPIKGLTLGKLCSNGKEQVKLDEWFLSTTRDQLKELSFNDGHALAATFRVAPHANVAHR